MTPTRIGDEWFVTSAGEQLAGPFKTNSDAWRWMDRYAGEPIPKAEQRSQWLFEQMELHGAASNAAVTPNVIVCGIQRNSAETPHERYRDPRHVTSRDVTRYGNIPETFRERPDSSRGYHIFADGAAVPNPGEGGWGVVVYLDGVEVEALSGGDPVTTNNRMEMTALLIAIETAQRFGAPVTIWSDSQYCVNGANDWRHKWKRHGWRKSPRATEFVKNVELWQAIDAALVDASRSRGITIKWVKGHAGIVGNERADQLAEIGRQAAAAATTTLATAKRTA